MSKKFNTHSIAESGLILAIVIIIDISMAYAFRALFPEGWAFQLSFIFIAILAFRRGITHAIIVNFARAWIVAAVSGSFFPPTATYGAYGILISLSLDYIVGSIFSILIAQLLVMKIKNIKWKFILWITIALTISFIASFISGGLVWGAYAWPGWGAWIYSLAYNFSSNFAALVATLIFAAVIIRVKPNMLEKVKEKTWE
ncbi:energy-coupled thiamine transporter ThiT [Mycoplasma marinum]|uniref:ECF transporter S component n=1 Tax=Mycoplasma marinum TaxID=1937190 RepID=A0A4R0XTS4_9MOLU|nr:energy-coupled thiamine transporter ThiT [Mycoplasma marinum]TCG11177.1 hypothetical protein C4B24_02745 [Mycoplasma marinum]